MSVLKPLAGYEPGLARNLRSFFELDCPEYELLFCARGEGDPALAEARRLAQQHPEIRAKVLIAGEPRCQNAKVHSLAAMAEASRGDVLVVSDSDIRTDAALLRSVDREFRATETGVVTFPYRAVPGPSPWSALEALGMNTEFWSGVLTAQHLFPMDFAVGPTMAIRKSCLEDLGGWKAVEDHLAEDFRIGQLARKAGHEVRLGTHVVEHHIGSQSLRENIAHRLRWRRSTRRSRPAGYWGEALANPLPWAMLLPLATLGATWSWCLLGVCAALRFLVAIMVGRKVLGDRLVLRRWWLLPVQDIASLFLWVGGLFGSKIVWRDREYRLEADGRLRWVRR